MADDLLPLLEAYNAGALTEMASFHGLTKKGPRPKGLTASLLAEALVEPRRIQAAWEALSPAERVAMEALLRARGRLSLRAVREALKAQKLIDSEATPAAHGHGRPPPNPKALPLRRAEDVLARLCLRGLVFAAPDERPLTLGRAAAPVTLRDFSRPLINVFIPQPIRRLLPAPPPQASAPAALAVSAVTESSARAFQRDLYLYWSFVRRQPLLLTAKGEPRKAQLKEVAGTLLVRVEFGKGEGELDYPRLRFVRLLLGRLKLLATQGDTVSAEAAATDFFARPAAERVRQSFEAWRGGLFWNELLQLPPQVRPRASAALQEADAGLMAARRVVLEYTAGLAQDHTETWAALAELVSQIRGSDYEFLFKRQPATSYDYSPYYGQRHPYSNYGNRFGLEFPDIHSEEDGWDKVEASFIRSVVTGPLHWLGLVDLGWLGEDTAAPPAAFRLTALGRWVLGLGPAPEIPAEGGRVIVQPNLHIVALDPVVDATLLTLDRFAERLSAERAVEYRLTRAALYAGQLQGWEVPRIKAFLQQQTGTALPGNVARTLDEWQAQHERIVLYPRVTLAHGLPEALDALAQHPRGAALVQARLTPQLARLRGPEAIPGVVRALGERGRLPLVTQAAAVAPGSVEADERGALRLLARQPSLYLHGHLAAFADPRGEAGYEVSDITVARAARAGLTAPRIVQRLEAVHKGPVPPALVRRIRAWAKHYGDAALEAVSLLQVRDAATLAELMSDPEIAALLQPFRPTAAKALARVRPQDVERLRKLLAERGVEVEAKLG